MTDYQTVQKELYAMLSAEYKGLSLRRSNVDSALWAVVGRAEALTLPGIEAHRAGESLWLLDFPGERWEKELQNLPATPPRYTGRHEEVYALCRLLLSHPAPLDGQPMEHIRQIYRFVSGDSRAGTILKITEETAVRLRLGLPVAAAAGGMLSLWLEEENS